MDTFPTKSLRILHLEDNASDAELIASELQRAWPECEIIHTASRASFDAALERGGFDVILSDFALPNFDGFAALKRVRERDPETPVILVSGTIGEEMAVSVLKAGAADYVLKDRLARLVTAIERAL